MTTGLRTTSLSLSQLLVVISILPR